MNWSLFLLFFGISFKCMFAPYCPKYLGYSTFSVSSFRVCVSAWIQVYLGNLVDLVPDHHNNVNITWILCEYHITLSTLCESESVNHSVMSNSWWPRGLKPSRLLCPWNSVNKNTGVVAVSFFRASSQPRNWTEVSCIAGRFFTVELLGKHTIL